jgi:hypothetical protein
MRRHKPGFALADVLFVMVVVTFVLIPMVGLFPMGHRALQKGHDICVASALAEAQISQLRASPFPTALPPNAPSVSSSIQTVGGIDYRVSTQLWPVAYANSQCTTVDVLVDVTYPDGLPFEYSTRFSSDTAGMQAP